MRNLQGDLIPPILRPYGTYLMRVRHGVRVAEP